MCFKSILRNGPVFHLVRQQRRIRQNKGEHGMTRPDRIESVDLSLAFLPLATPVSDAKVFTGRQKPLTRVAFLFARVAAADGAAGLGFSYSKRAGGPGLYAHAREIAPELIGEDPSDIGRLWEKLAWAGASVGRGGLSVQAIAALDVALWDLKARRAGLPLAKLLGAYRDRVPCYNTSGGFLSSALAEVLDNARTSLALGIGGIKIKVGHPDSRVDIALAAALDTPVATGEMLTSVAEHERMISARAADFVQPDAPRVGGITPFLKVLALAEQRRLSVAPHFAMELHVHLAAAYPHEVWVEHFDWLEPLFNERLLVADGAMIVPDRPGLGLTLSEQAAAWTVDRTAIGPGGV
jgi:L-alanine-DL-glutamate epimerase-like enolase superfamily enzyme